MAKRAKNKAKCFVIVREALPTRCEVCHQADMFDAVGNQCARCNSLVAGRNQRITEPAHRNGAITEEEIAELLIDKQLPWSFLILVPAGVCCSLAIFSALLFQDFISKHWIIGGLVVTMSEICFLLMTGSGFTLVVTEAKKIFAKEPQEKNL